MIKFCHGLPHRHFGIKKENIKLFANYSDEEVLNIDTITPPVKCNTGDIFKVFRENFYKQISKEEADKLLKMKSIDILNNLSIKEANDLYEPAISAFRKFEEYGQNGWYFSGSGSSFFKVNNVK